MLCCATHLAFAGDSHQLGVSCDSLLKYGLIFNFSAPGEHPAAMQHNAAAAPRPVSPALLLVACIAALWTSAAIVATSVEWWPSCPLTRRCSVVAQELGASLVGGGIYQRRRLNGERLGNARREVTSSGAVRKTAVPVTSTTKPTISSTTTTAAR